MTRASGTRPDSAGATRACPRDACLRRRGFSLLELLVVMTVTLLLTGLLLPALVQLRENAHRVICSSHLKQIGYATVMYADEHDGLPEHPYSEPDLNKQELMSAHLGQEPEAWAGLGRVYREGFCGTPEIFYCPSHAGEHPYERYERTWDDPGGPRIYVNYHYAGERDWVDGSPRRLNTGENIVLATDGLRTVRDYNHRVGVNVLRGDASVTWRDDFSGEIRHMLPAEPLPTGDADYEDIWDLIGAQE